MSPTPQRASKEVRTLIIDALRDSKRRFMDMNDSTSRNYLDLWDIKPKAIYEDTAKYLEGFELFLLPRKEAKQIQKYQCILHYPEEPDYPALIIHVKLSPKGDPPRVKVAVHPHNTGFKPLPDIPVTPSIE